jgi:phosphopantothenoylcysteine decarboxylase/phosphopantothenate--cysteine ligase
VIAVLEHSEAFVLNYCILCSYVHTDTVCNCMLDGCNVALGVSGSIAAVKVVELAHEIRRHGASVRGVMSQSAQGIIHPWAVDFATDHPVITEITGSVEHIELCGRDGWADVLLVAPATANTVGKIASAVDDTPVTTCATTAIGADVPTVIAPAMHQPMYDHPGVVSALETLEKWGINFVAPRIEESKAKIATEDAIVRAVSQAVHANPLDGTRVLVTAGATAEAIDPIRILTSRASGQTGHAVAHGCQMLGATVELVTTEQDVSVGTTHIVESSTEMHATVRERVSESDALISAAAISDYTVDKSPEKLRSGHPRSLSLKPTPKVIGSVRDSHPDLPIVGFKTETTRDRDSLIKAARAIQSRYDLQFAVANSASVMGESETEAYIVTETEVTTFSGSKTRFGLTVASELATALS